VSNKFGNCTDRREFLKGMAAISAASGLSSVIAAQQLPQNMNSVAGFAGKFNAIQMGPHTMLDEGIDHALDLIQETAAINCVMVYSHTYHSDLRKPPQMLATDHGVPVRDMRNRKLPSVWIKHHEQYFKNTSLRHPETDSSYEYADRDLLKEMVEPCRKRGMKLYARILEGGGPRVAGLIKNYSSIVTRDVTAIPQPRRAGTIPTTAPGGMTRWKTCSATISSTACNGARSAWAR
jgi:hypothetical protein